MRFSGRTVAAATAALALCVGATGCQIKKDGAVAANAPDVVTVISSVNPANSATSVSLDPSTVSALQTLGVNLKPSGTATASGSVVSFPITAGYVEIHQDRSHQPGFIEGSLLHEGSGINVVGPGTTVRLTDFAVDPGGSMLYGTVNGKVGVPLLFLDGRKVQASTNTAGQVVLTGTVAKLTSQAANALDQAFATTAITAGTPLGSVRVVAGSSSPLPAAANSLNEADITGSSYTSATDHVTEIPRLTGQGTTLSLDPGVAQTLTGAGISLTTTGSATAAGTAVTFPITDGFVAIHSDKGFQPGYVVGVVDHQGSGITLSGGGTSVNLSNFVVNPGTSVLTGTVGGKDNVPLFFLDGSKLKITPTANGATLDGTVAELTQPAAKALDAAFSTQAFTPGLAIGTVHLVATGGA